MVALAALGLSLASRVYLYPKFIQLEDEQAVRNANIGLELLNNEINIIADRPPHWSYWDDTYQFMLNRNDSFITSNLGVESQLSLQANLVGIYDLKGNKVWSRAVHLETLKSFNLDEYHNGKLPAAHPMLSH